MSSLWADIGNFVSDTFNSIGSFIGNASTELGVAPPSAPNGGGSLTPSTASRVPTTTASGSISTSGGSGTSATSAQSSVNSGGGSLFSSPIAFIEGLLNGETWIRLGLILLGIALFIVAIRMMIVHKSNPIAKAMKDIGVQS